ncbi:Jag N-terminal domain-containing protein [bacterium]|nr:Jag N-terminal domain-containing protein [bacterium]
MRKLTTREKTMIGLCGFVAIIVLALFIFRPLLNQWRSASEEISLKQTQLKSDQEMVNFGPSAIAIEDKLRAKTGLGSPIISDEQFNQLKEQLTIGDEDDGSNKLNINKATKTELTKLGFDKYLINSILAYRVKVGQFENLEELKNIRGTIFEGQLAEAIISQRLSQIIQDVGIKRIDRLDAKLVSGKKTETISRDVKKIFVDELYLNELETEKKNLESQEYAENPNPDEEQRQDRQFEPLPDVIPDELKLNIAQAIIAHKGEVEQKSVEWEGATKEEAVQLALYKLSAKEEDVDIKVLDEGRKGFWGFFAKPVKVRVTKKEDEQGIIAGFREALMKYNDEFASAINDNEDFYYDDYDWDEEYYDENYEDVAEEPLTDDNSGEIEQVEPSEIPSIGVDSSEGESSKGESDESGSDEIAEAEGSKTPSTEETASESGLEEGISDEDVMVSELAEYLIKVSQKKNEFRKWLYNVSISYQKQAYVVEIAFKCEMTQLVNIMCKIESSFRWLSVRDLKISIANQEKPILSANISVLATVL